MTNRLDFFQEDGENPTLPRSHQETYSLGGVSIGASRLYSKQPLGYRLANPATIPTGDGQDVAWSPDGRYLAVVHDNSPYLSVYSMQANVLTKIANPAVLPAGHGAGVAWSPDGKALAVGHWTSPYFTVYTFSFGTMTKIANPAVLPGGLVTDMSWSPSGRYLAVTTVASPGVIVYEYLGGTITKLTNQPSALPGAGQDVAWSPDGRFLAVAHESSPQVDGYFFDGSQFTTKNRAIAHPSMSFGVGVSPDGRYVAYASGTVVGNAPVVNVYPINPYSIGSVLQSVPNPSPSNNTYCCVWSADGRYLLAGIGSWPFMYVLRFEPDSPVNWVDFGSSISPPPGAVNNASFSRDGRFLAIAHSVSPYFAVYDASDSKTTPGTLLEINQPSNYR